MKVCRKLGMGLGYLLSLLAEGLPGSGQRAGPKWPEHCGWTALRVNLSESVLEEPRTGQNKREYK